MTGGPVIPRRAPRSAGDDGTDAQRVVVNTVDALWSASHHQHRAVSARVPNDECERSPAAVHRNLTGSHRHPSGRSCEAVRADIVEYLLADSDFRVALASLCLPGGSRIGVLGASMGVDAVHWVALLSDVLAAARTHVELVDHCSTGCTTTEALAALPGLISQRPQHILIMLGVDDARRHGAASGVLRVSMAETHRNLSALQAMAQGEAHVGTTLITPPPADPRHEQSADSYWLAEDLNSVANMVRSIDPDAVCLRTGTPPSQDYWLADGVHPSVVGHTDIVRRIITHFSRAHQPEESCRTRMGAASPNAPTTASRG